jgi:hypothetical protein
MPTSAAAAAEREREKKMLKNFQVISFPFWLFFLVFFRMAGMGHFGRGCRYPPKGAHSTRAIYIDVCAC